LKLQNFERKNEKIRSVFLSLKKKYPERFAARLDLSWSNWGFGTEPLEISAARLMKAGIRYIELHGNHYGPDLGYRPKETLDILDGYGIKTAGICGMFSADNDLSSSHAIHRQAAIDYIRREIEFAVSVNAGYMLIVPGAVGRPAAYDANEFERSAETLRMLGDLFYESHIKAAIEPIRSAEVSFIHTVADAKRYIEAIGHPGISHINGDVYHMQSEEKHIGEAILEAGELLVNLHVADSNRCALGDGSLDIDTVIMALYITGHNRSGKYVTPEPLGPGGDPYPAMYGKADGKALDRLADRTAKYFREREDMVRG
jgi:D-psicose/D-tagatose/L-ribulose 3-epimerase